MEKEVMRKQRAVTGPTGLEGDPRYDPTLNQMPPINEAENEDKDYQNDVKNPGHGFNYSGVSRNDKANTRAGVDYTDQGDHSTFQKDSEPGNKQGEDAPVGEGGMRNYYGASPHSAANPDDS